MRLGEIIKNFRKENKLTMQEFANKCGLSKGYISMLENDFKPSNTNKKIVPSITVIKKLADGMKIDFNDLFYAMDGDTIVSWSDNAIPIPSENIIFDDYFPLRYCTNLSAGTLEELLEAEPDAIVYVPIKYQMMKKRLHAFKVNGSSMDNVIADGSIVITEDISHLNKVKDGTIVVVFIDGTATVKRLYTRDNTITLMPDSSDKSHLPIMINTEDKQVSIIGRVIWHMNPDDIERMY